MHRTLAALFALVALLVPLAACGGDDDGGGSVQAYCDLVDEVNQQEDFPSDDQLEELVDAAPGEISDDIEFVADRLREANDNPETAEEVFEDSDFTDRLENIEAFEEENCGGESGDDGE